MKDKGMLNNRGAAMVSVLVVTVFITIIATTMLYISAQNYQNKQTDYQNKQSFYGAEEVLDRLKAELVMDVQEAYCYAYNEVMKNFMKLAESDRKQFYHEAYLDKLNEIWDDRYNNAAVGMNMTETVRFAMTEDVIAAPPTPDEPAKTIDLSKRIYKVDGYGETSTTLLSGDIEKQFVIKGVRAMHTSGNYTTFIYTDICLAPPDIDLSEGAGSSIEDIELTDYVVYMNWRKADYDE